MATQSLSNVVSFPRGKKRGAKVRHGPCADLIDLPGSSHHGEELMLEWDWLFQAFGNWQSEDPRVPVDGEERMELERRISTHPWKDQFLAPDYQSKMREQVICFRERVVQRAQLKAWVRALGAGERDMGCPERALEFLFKRYGKVFTPVA